MLVKGYFKEENPLKGLRIVPVILDRGEEEKLGCRVRPGGGGDLMIKTPFKGLRSVHKVLKNRPFNDILVSFVLVMINNELCLYIFSNHSFGGLKSLFLLPWPIRVSVDST